MTSNLSISFIDSVPSDVLTEISADAAEILLDNNMEDGLLKDIPWFGTVVKLYKTARGFREYFFDKKVLAFLFNLKDISQEKREEFIESNFSEKKAKQKMGEKLLHYLDRFEDFEKAIMLSNAFKAYIEGYINQIIFFNLCYAIDKFKTHNYWDFVFYWKGFVGSPSQFEVEHYINCGLLTAERNSRALLLPNKKVYFFSKTGEDFGEFVLDVNENILKEKYIDSIMKIKEFRAMTDDIFEGMIKSKDDTYEYLNSLSNADLFNSTIDSFCLRFRDNTMITKTGKDEFYFRGNKVRNNK